MGCRKITQLKVASSILAPSIRIQKIHKAKHEAQGWTYQWCITIHRCSKKKNNHSRKTFASLMPNRVWLAHPGGYVLRLFQCNKLVRLGVQIKQLWISAGTIFIGALKVAEKITQIIVASNQRSEYHNSAIRPPKTPKRNEGKGTRASQTTIPNDFFTAQLKVQGWVNMDVTSLMLWAKQREDCEERKKIESRSTENVSWSD